MTIPRTVDRASLVCHPDTPAPAVRGIEVRVDRKGGTLALAYRLEGDLGRLLIPAPQSGGMAAGLWRHTCFEIFIACRGRGASYHELNFSPSGQWAAYAFRRYRHGGLLEERELEPRVTLVAGAPDRLELGATVDLGRLSPAYPGSALSVALSCVVEGIDGSLSYWALKHPPGRPDFHHPDAFLLELPPGAGADVAAADSCPGSGP